MVQIAALTVSVMLAQANVEPVPATVIIWAGARTRAEADVSLARLETASKAWP